MPRHTNPTLTDFLDACDALVAQRTTAAICEYGRYRGHPVVCLEGEEDERYADDLTPTVDAEGKGIERPCVSCGLTATPDGPDPCLGRLPGVVSACCGHGVEAPYVKRHASHAPGTSLRGQDARALFTHYGVGPRLLTKAESPAPGPSSLGEEAACGEGTPHAAL